MQPSQIAAVRPAGAQEEEAAAEAVSELRQKIDLLDRELVQLIALRCGLARSTGEFKQAGGVPLVDLSREAAVVRHAAALAREAGVDEEVIRRVFWSLIELARRCQGAAAAPETCR